MTDNEIITILECCASDENIKCCRKCALCEKYDCYSEISKNALNLINRQKAEIERLKGSVITNNVVEISKIRKIAKSEAIKEFAERLKEKSMTKFDWSEAIDVENIDDLVKEMTESEEKDNA